MKNFYCCFFCFQMAFSLSRNAISSAKHYSHTAPVRASSYLIVSWDQVLKFESKILISLSLELLELSCSERLVNVKFCQLFNGWSGIKSPKLSHIYVFLLIHHINHVSLRCRQKGMSSLFQLFTIDMDPRSNSSARSILYFLQRLH